MLPVPLLITGEERQNHSQENGGRCHDCAVFAWLLSHVTLRSTCKYILGDKLHLQSFSASPMMLLLKVEVTVGDEGQLAPSQLRSKSGFAC